MPLGSVLDIAGFPIVPREIATPRTGIGAVLLRTAFAGARNYFQRRFVSDLGRASTYALVRQLTNANNVRRVQASRGRRMLQFLRAPRRAFGYYSRRRVAPRRRYTVRRRPSRFSRVRWARSSYYSRRRFRSWY